jgi:chromosome segregation ATPase
MIDGIIDTSAPPPDQSKYVNSLEIRLKSSENDVKSKESDIQSLQKEIKHLVLSPFNASRSSKNTKLEKMTNTVEERVEEAEAKAKAVQTELDDLLLVLEEMQEKTTRYRETIKSLGGEVTEDEEDEGDE